MFPQFGTLHSRYSRASAKLHSRDPVLMLGRSAFRAETGVPPAFARVGNVKLRIFMLRDPNSLGERKWLVSWHVNKRRSKSLDVAAL